jgi:hypothetical protein
VGILPVGGLALLLGVERFMLREKFGNSQPRLRSRLANY